MSRSPTTSPPGWSRTRTLFDELEDKGFIRKLEGHHLGPSGIGQTARWALDEYPTATDGKPALKRFARWSKSRIPAQNM